MFQLYYNEIYTVIEKLKCNDDLTLYTCLTQKNVIKLSGTAVLTLKYSVHRTLKSVGL